MVVRLRAVLPTRWFPDEAPVLEGLLVGLASAWAWSYGLLDYVKAQTRILSATDIWLDIVSQDFFGASLPHLSGQRDEVFRGRIRRELFRERGTRRAIILAVQDSTGQVPVVFEPGRTTDTGGYGSLTGAGSGLAYGAAGGWGNLDLPFQCFVTAYRPLDGGIAEVSGWGNPNGAYGAGALEYADLAMVLGQVKDADIYAAVAGVLPIAAVGWTRIKN